MTYFNNKNGWFWAFIILLIVNIAAIGTMVYTVNKIHENADVDLYHDTAPGKRTPNKTFMRKNMAKQFQKKMGYSDEQMKTLRKIRMEHMKNMRNKKKQLTKYQKALFDAISSNDDDSDKIEELKNQILDAEREIVNESISFYKKVKKNSTPEQMKKMNDFYKRYLFHKRAPIHNTRDNK